MPIEKDISFFLFPFVNIYPTSQQDQKCKYNESSIGSNCVEYNAVLPAGDEASLEGAVATVGPISVCIDASHSSFQASLIAAMIMCSFIFLCSTAL